MRIKGYELGSEKGNWGCLTWEWEMESVWREEIWGTELCQENEQELEDLKEDGDCKGEGIMVLLRPGDDVGIRRSSWSAKYRGGIGIPDGL